MTMKKILILIAVAFFNATAFALDDAQLITWSSFVEKLDEDNLYKVVFEGKIAQGYHTYTLTDEFSATEFMDVVVNGGELVGDPYELGTPKEETDEFGDLARHYYDEIKLAQNIKLNDAAARFTGTIYTNACTGGACKPEYYDFNVTIGASDAAVAADDQEDAVIKDENKEKSNIWALILEAILWGFAMLLTPCVFPMVPMTVSFFMKGSENVAQGRFKAAMYGIFIILLYIINLV